jgi:hypothetical protein
MPSKHDNDAKGGIPDPHGQWKQATQPAYSRFPEVAYDRDATPEARVDRDTLPETTLGARYSPYGPGDVGKELGSPSSHGYTTHPPEANSTRETRYCWGLPRTAFCICVLLVVVVLAAAIGGGVAGGLKSHNSHPVTGVIVTLSSSQPTPTQSSTPSNPTHSPLSGSKLAVLNWTDEASIERRAVFYQIDSALFVSQAQGQNTTWTHLNISAQFLQYEGELALDLRSGTPLAVSATPWQAGKNAPWVGGAAFIITLFYFDQLNQIRQLWTNAGDLSIW